MSGARRLPSDPSGRPAYRFLVRREVVGELAACLYNTGQIADLTIEDAPLEEIIGQLFTDNGAAAASATAPVQTP